MRPSPVADPAAATARPMIASGSSPRLGLVRAGEPTMTGKRVPTGHLAPGTGMGVPLVPSDPRDHDGCHRDDLVQPVARRHPPEQPAGSGDCPSTGALGRHHRKPDEGKCLNKRSMQRKVCHSRRCAGHVPADRSNPCVSSPPSGVSTRGSPASRTRLTGRTALITTLLVANQLSQNEGRSVPGQREGTAAAIELSGPTG